MTPFLYEGLHCTNATCTACCRGQKATVCAVSKADPATASMVTTTLFFNAGKVPGVNLPLKYGYGNSNMSM